MYVHFTRIEYTPHEFLEQTAEPPTALYSFPLLDFKLKNIYVVFIFWRHPQANVVFTGRFETFGNLLSRFITGQHVVTFALDVRAK